MNYKKKIFIRLGIFAAVILGFILFGKLSNNLDLVLDILSAIVLVLLGITILVTVHELGHFLTAKAFGMRVETFSIGFPPKIFSFKKGDTEYQIGATPLGGYVKISGMIDESLDTDQLKEPPKSYEFRSKPVWQRLIVMTGGVIMNVILGIFIFSMLKFMYGEQKLPMSAAEYGIQVIDNSLGQIVGFQTGDKLISYNGESFPYFYDYANPNLLIDDEGYYEVERNGQIVRLEIPPGIQDRFSDDTIAPLLFIPDMPAIIEVMEGGPGDKAGLKTGDQIVKVDSFPIHTFSDLQQLLKNRMNDSVYIEFLRKNELHNTIAVLDSGRLHVRRDESFLQSKMDTIRYGFFESFIPGTKHAFSFLSLNVKGLGQVVTGKASASKSVMGPLQIAKKYLDMVKVNGLEGFMVLTASLSMILAFVNILPIPALDGGHVMFLLIEAIMRREPPLKVRMIAQQIGMILIILLMIFVLFNDAIKLPKLF
ncbi:MAG: RIP metalloprotease RseP [Bacteroidetes bacterium]|nr:MAG: RIP metalloprotease RseP [Bacteroidota bacterium]